MALEFGQWFKLLAYATLYLLLFVCVFFSVLQLADMRQTLNTAAVSRFNRADVAQTKTVYLESSTATTTKTLIVQGGELATGAPMKQKPESTTILPMVRISGAVDQAGEVEDESIRGRLTRRQVIGINKPEMQM